MASMVNTGFFPLEQKNGSCFSKGEKEGKDEKQWWVNSIPCILDVNQVQKYLQYIVKIEM